MYNCQDLAKTISEVAKKQGKTVNKVLIGCSLGKSTISNLKEGRAIAYDSLAKIADYLDVSVDYLLGRTQKETPHQTVIGHDYIGHDNIVNTGISDEERQIIDVYKTLSLSDKAKFLTYIDKLNNKKEV